MVGPVRSQENCGACWAFSTIGVAESMYAIKNGTLYPFSVQEVGRCIPDTPFCLRFVCEHTYTYTHGGTAEKSCARCRFRAMRYARTNWLSDKMDIDVSLGQTDPLISAIPLIF